MFTYNNRIAKTGLALLLAALVLLIPMGKSLAANPPLAGQPNQSCEDIGIRPGNAAMAPGSAFNPTGTSGTVYAGEQPQNSVNSHSVSQYDVACFQVSQH